VEDDALASKGRIPLATGVDNVVLPVVAALLMLAM
jgi:dolichol kinase